MFVSLVIISLSQALIITRDAGFFHCSGCMFDLFIVLWDIPHAVNLQRLAEWC